MVEGENLHRSVKWVRILDLFAHAYWPGWPSTLRVVIQRSPAHLIVEPGLAEAMQPHQAEAIRQWETYHLRYVRLCKDMYKSEAELLMAEGLTDKAARSQVNGVFELASTEIALRNFWRLPGLAIQKFFMGHREPPAPGFCIIRSTVNSGPFTK